MMSSPSPYSDRAFVGLLATSPLLGVAAALSTLRLVSLGTPAAAAVPKGALAGALLWAPLAIAGGMFYPLELALRPMVSPLAATPPPAEGAPLTQYEATFGRPVRSTALPASLSSKAAAGAATGLAVSVGGVVLRAARKRPPTAAVVHLVTLALCGAAGVAMPAFEEVAAHMPAWRGGR